MRSLFFIYFIILSSVGFTAETVSPDFPSYEIISKVEDSSLKVGRTKVIFQFSGFDYLASTLIVWSANKMIDTVLLGDKNEITEVLISGKYNFKFYHNSQYKEIIIPKLEFESGYCYTISIHFKLANRDNIHVKKPIIYLYPEVSTLIEVKVKPKGKLIFTYPLYEDGWQVTANPDGTLVVNEQAYNYLFWESEQEYLLIDYSFIDGFLVEGANSLTFLEDKLSAIGLNSKEKADFITFWGPQLIQNKRNFIHFYTNEECNRFAELTITPQPKSIFRLYMVFSPFKSDGEYEISNQELPIYNRDGFTVLEWGGSELSEINLLNKVE